MSAGPDLGARLADVRGRIEAAARRVGRDPAGVTLVGASKTVPAARVADAVAAGLTDVGENRAQELLAKAGEVGTPGGPPRWHVLGPLQRNQVRALFVGVAVNLRRAAGWVAGKRPQVRRPGLGLAPAGA